MIFLCITLYFLMGIITWTIFIRFEYFLAWPADNVSDFFLVMMWPFFIMAGIFFFCIPEIMKYFFGSFNKIEDLRNKIRYFKFKK